MADPRLDPPLSMPTYAVREPLVRWLSAEARLAFDALGRYRLLDVGCGEKPYRDLFAPYAAEHVGVDPVANPLAELRGPIEALPVEDASFDVVLCAQVLEHVDDPAQGVRELARVTRPGGRVLLSTHGTYVFHPAPVDHWRWTHTGLERLLRENGDWASVRVTPGAGTAASLAMLNAIYVEHVLRRTPLRFLRGGAVSAINRLGRALDRRLSLLREPRPGTLAANYHVVAERAS
ncbi:MAG: class I SAM-dependent methyltransferase [Thermoleophilia bacterium]|nr:class I SAM-dependent methyltransferase [Thermoleophilia bacterium]